MMFVLCCSRACLYLTVFCFNIAKHAILVLCLELCSVLLFPFSWMSVWVPPPPPLPLLICLSLFISLPPLQPPTPLIVCVKCMCLYVPKCVSMCMGVGAGVQKSPITFVCVVDLAGCVINILSTAVCGSWPPFRCHIYWYFCWVSSCWCSCTYQYVILSVWFCLLSLVCVQVDRTQPYVFKLFYVWLMSHVL